MVKCTYCHEPANLDLDAGPVFGVTLVKPEGVRSVWFCSDEHGREWIRLEANNA